MKQIRYRHPTTQKSKRTNIDTCGCGARMPGKHNAGCWMATLPARVGGNAERMRDWVFTVQLHRQDGTFEIEDCEVRAPTLGQAEIQVRELYRDVPDAIITRWKAKI
jgi:hypothetical protein